MYENSNSSWCFSTEARGHSRAMGQCLSWFQSSPSFVLPNLSHKQLKHNNEQFSISSKVIIPRKKVKERNPRKCGSNGLNHKWKPWALCLCQKLDIGEAVISLLFDLGLDAQIQISSEVKKESKTSATAVPEAFGKYLLMLEVGKGLLRNSHFLVSSHFPKFILLYCTCCAARPDGRWCCEAQSLGFQAQLCRFPHAWISCGPIPETSFPWRRQWPEVAFVTFDDSMFQKNKRRMKKTWYLKLSGLPGNHFFVKQPSASNCLHP